MSIQKNLTRCPAKLAAVSVLCYMTASTLVAQQPTSAPATDEMTVLRAEVKMLRAQLKEQATEIDRLKLQLSQNTKVSSTSQPATAPAAYTYLGKAITKPEFTRLYSEFGTKMIVVDGKVLDAGEAAAWAAAWARLPAQNRTMCLVNSELPAIGRECQATGQVTKVNDDGIIANTSPGWTDTIISYRIRGVDTSKYAEGKKVWLTVLFVGTCKVDGRTIQDFVLKAPAPTEAQFADALAKGLKLYTWSINEKELPLKAVSTPVK